MKLNRSELGHRRGEKLVKALKDGTFKKNYKTNHGTDFTKGREELHRNRFNNYLVSCGCFLMDNRLEHKRRGYCG